jgi:hypothetical protein
MNLVGFATRKQLTFQLRVLVSVQSVNIHWSESVICARCPHRLVRSVAADVEDYIQMWRVDVDL